MIKDNLTIVASSAKDLSRNPLGIIALFIVLVYGFACLLFGFSAETLIPEERTPIIWFIIFFPVLVLFLFGWLVSKHHDKLYSPKDYRDDSAFLQTLNSSYLSKQTSSFDNDEAIKELMQHGMGFEIVSQQEKRIEKDLNEKGLDFSNNTSKVLIRHLAVAQMINWFEDHYKAIFGSQITLLRRLQGDTEGLTLNEVNNYFTNVKNENSEVYKNWNTEQYLAFLKESNLIEESQEKIYLTNSGKEFLKILSGSGYTEQKAL